MAEAKLSSGLFFGTHFDRKRFAADFARFQKGSTPTAAAAVHSAPSSEKKRKRKAKAKKNKKKRSETAADSSSGEARLRWLLLRW
jgi:ATP-dependent RNA helicase DDX52/ROK1